MSCDLTVEQIIAARAPQYSSHASLSTLISLAECEVDSSFGDLRTQATAMLTLHFILIDERGGSSGAIKSEREGQMARSYDLGSMMNDSILNSTTYGAEFVRYRRATHLTPLTRAQRWIPGA